MTENVKIADPPHRAVHMAHRLHIILDQSGSMQTMNAATYEGARELVANPNPTDVVVCITTFNSSVVIGKYMDSETAYSALDPDGTRCTGQTALHDALGMVIEHELRKSGVGHVTFAIVTDGVENASVTHTQESVRKLVQQTQAKGWRVLFLGANQDAVLEAGRVGIAAGSALTFDGDPEHVLHAFRCASDSTRRVISGEDGAFTPVERMKSATRSVAQSSPRLQRRSRLAQTPMPPPILRQQSTSTGT